jgi:hypothetical protein
MWLFALSLRDRRKVGIAIDGLFAHVLPAIEQEYGKGNSNQSAEEGAKHPIACLVVVHHRLRSFGRKPNACAGCGFLRTEPLEIAAALWRLAEASNKQLGTGGAAARRAAGARRGVLR